MTTILILLFLWIVAGGLWVFFGPYNWKLGDQRLYIRLLVNPFLYLVLIVYWITSKIYEAYDWLVCKYYKHTSYTRKYLKRGK